MVKVNDIFKVFDWANYITKDEDESVYLWRNKPTTNMNFKNWEEARFYECEINILYLDTVTVEEFKNKDYTQCIIEREKPLKTYDDFVKWLKTKGDVNEEWSYFFKENNKEEVMFRFYPVDVNLKVNDVELCTGTVECEEFFTGTPEQCKRVIEAMLEE